MDQVVEAKTPSSTTRARPVSQSLVDLRSGFDPSQHELALKREFSKVFEKDPRLQPLVEILKRRPNAIVFVGEDKMVADFGAPIPAGIQRDKELVYINRDEVQRSAKAIAGDYLRNGKSAECDLIALVGATVAPVAAHELRHLVDRERVRKQLGSKIEFGPLREAEMSAMKDEQIASVLTAPITNQYKRSFSDTLRDNAGDLAKEFTVKNGFTEFPYYYSQHASILQMDQAEFRKTYADVEKGRSSEVAQSLQWTKNVKSFGVVQQYFRERLIVKELG